MPKNKIQAIIHKKNCLVNCARSVCWERPICLMRLPWTGRWDYWHNGTLSIVFVSVLETKRAIAQLVSVQVWGTWGRRFKSGLPDIFFLTFVFILFLKSISDKRRLMMAEVFKKRAWCVHLSSLWIFYWISKLKSLYYKNESAISYQWYILSKLNNYSDTAEVDVFRFEISSIF